LIFINSLKSCKAKLVSGSNGEEGSRNTTVVWPVRILCEEGCVELSEEAGLQLLWLWFERQEQGACVLGCVVYRMSRF
jgi:hypothetical protein